ncbi:hypothetical protein FOA52_004758 [Chlamydomonas sp. UWO 241]|nr:hypothetical protein FOA52_004758 [Chlamydomonas sp. UWO 241]
MNLDQADQLADEAEHATANAVLKSPDLLSKFWPWLDPSSKASLRVVCRELRSHVDGLVRVAMGVGFSAQQLSAALIRWPHVHDLTLMGITGASLRPLTTASLAGLTSLTLREAGLAVSDDDPERSAWDMAPLSSSLAAKLRVLDLSGCVGLRSIDVARGCEELVCVRMPGVTGVSDLSPLGACSQLEELWMSENPQIASVAPLKACPKLRKLYLGDMHSVLRDRRLGDVMLLLKTCPQLEDPSKVVLEGLVLTLRPGFSMRAWELAVTTLPCIHGVACDGACDRPSKQADAMELVLQIAVSSMVPDMVAADFAAAGIFAALVQLLGLGVQARSQRAAALALGRLAVIHDVWYRPAIIGAGAVPPLVGLLGPKSSAGMQMAAARALFCLGHGSAENRVVIAAAGAIPSLVQLLGSDSADSDVQFEAACALNVVAEDNAENQAMIADSCGITTLVQLLGPASSTGLQVQAAGTLSR